MNTKNKDTIFWKPCSTCQGQGEFLQGPSKRKKRLYKIALEEYSKKITTSRPQEPEKDYGICDFCQGSGLIESELENKIDHSYPHVAIIGAGIGGSALAVALLDRGIPFTLYERDKSFNERSQGYGLTLQQASNSMKALGIKNLENGIRSTKHIVHNEEGKILAEWGLRKWVKEPKENSKRKNIHIARQELRSAILERLNNRADIKWGHKLLNFTQNEKDLYKLEFEHKGEKLDLEADLIIGADGIRSAVRQKLIPNEKIPLQYLDCMVILGICNLDSLKNLESDLLDSETVFQTANGKERIYVMPYDKDSVMWQLSFPIAESEAIKLNKKGPQAMKDLSLEICTWHSPIPEIIKNTPNSLITGYPAYDRDLFNHTLLENQASVSLLGDAAHPMSPFKGQGANQAILDSISLARRIHKHGKNFKKKNINLREDILKDFESEMEKRTKSKALASRLAAQGLHTEKALEEHNGPRGGGFTEK